MTAQSRLFDEAESLAQTSTAAQDTDPMAAEVPTPTGADANVPATRPARGKRAPLAANLPRVDVVHDVPEVDRTRHGGLARAAFAQMCGDQMCTIAFITFSDDAHKILDHIGAGTETPCIALARGLPLREGGRLQAVGEGMEAVPGWDRAVSVGCLCCALW